MFSELEGIELKGTRQGSVTESIVFYFYLHSVLYVLN